MKHKIDIRPRAAIDICDGFDRYEAQQAGLGHEFLQELEVFFNNVLVNPFTHPYYDTPVRQGGIGSFPYMVYFEVLIESIIVYDVLMTNQAYQKAK
jgi:hypothetical protein